MVKLRSIKNRGFTPLEKIANEAGAHLPTEHTTDAQTAKKRKSLSGFTPLEKIANEIGTHLPTEHTTNAHTARPVRYVQALSNGVKKRNSSMGFSLFEIVIALGVLAIGILGVLALFPVGLDSQKKAIDYSMLNTFAQWKMSDITYRAGMSGADNSLNQASEYPQAGPDPEPFENNRYFWHYYVSLPHIGVLDTLYRIDLVIYAIENTTTDPIGSFTSYVEMPKDI